MTVTIVTPWQNHVELAPAYWEAINAAQPDEVIVVDDGSDPPLEFADIRFPEPRGFHAACNAGLDRATSDAVVFLNNDIEMIRPGWLDSMRHVLLLGTLVGAELRYDAHTQVDGEAIPYLDGWCIGGMREDLRALGGWDETLKEPAYYGDNLLCLRARQAGMTLRAVDVPLRHIGNATSGDDTARRHAASMHNHGVYVQAVRDALVTA